MAVSFLSVETPPPAPDQFRGVLPHATREGEKMIFSLGFAGGVPRRGEGVYQYAPHFWNGLR
jgi:hypothetical protein